MTVVAPVTGLVAAIIPVAVGIATGDRLSPLAVAGIVAAVVGGGADRWNRRDVHR